MEALAPEETVDEEIELKLPLLMDNWAELVDVVRRVEPLVMARPNGLLMDTFVEFAVTAAAAEAARTAAAAAAAAAAVALFDLRPPPVLGRGP